MSDEFRVGIIATGNMGRAHVRCVNALDGAEMRIVELAEAS